MTYDDALMAAKTMIYEVWGRLFELIQAPLGNSKILWAAIPLLIATLFIILYFGRYRKEELGWNTAFGNTMVFLFVAINLIKEMYYQGGSGSFDNITTNSVYLSISIGLIAGGSCLMLMTYFHVLPKKIAFFLFSAPPINVAVYVIMTIVYANVPPDWVTVLAAIVFLAVILIAGKTVQALEGFIGLEHRTLAEDVEKRGGYERPRSDEDGGQG